MKNWEEIVGGRLFLILAVFFVILSAGYFLKEIWNAISLPLRFLLSAIIGIGFITTGGLIKSKTQKIFYEAVTSIGFSILLTTNFVAVFFKTIDLSLAFVFQAIILFALIIFTIKFSSVFLSFITILGGYFPIFFFGVNPNFSLLYITLLNLSVVFTSTYKRFSTIGYINFFVFIISFSFTFYKIFNNFLQDQISLPILLTYTLINYVIFSASILIYSIIKKQDIIRLDQDYLFIINFIFYIIGQLIINNYVENFAFLYSGLYTMFFFFTNIGIYFLSRSIGENLENLATVLSLNTGFLTGLSFLLISNFDYLWILYFLITAIIFSLIKDKKGNFFYYSLSHIIISFFVFIFYLIFNIDSLNFGNILLSFFIILAVLCLITFNYERVKSVDYVEFSKSFFLMELFVGSLLTIWAKYIPFIKKLFETTERTDYFFFIVSIIILSVVYFIILSIIFSFPIILTFLITNKIIKEKEYLFYSFSLWFFPLILVFMVSLNRMITESFLLFILFLIFINIILFKKIFASTKSGDFRIWLIGLIITIIHLFILNILQIPYPQQTLVGILHSISILFAILGVASILLYDYLKYNKQIDDVFIRSAGISFFINLLFIVISLLIIQIIPIINEEFYLKYTKEWYPFFNIRFISFIFLIAASLFLYHRSNTMLSKNEEMAIDYKTLGNTMIIFINLFVLIGFSQEILHIFYNSNLLNWKIYYTLVISTIWIVYSFFAIYIGIKVNSKIWRHAGFAISLLAIINAFTVIFYDIPSIFKAILSFIMGLSLLLVAYLFNRVGIKANENHNNSKT